MNKRYLIVLGISLLVLTISLVILFNNKSPELTRLNGEREFAMWEDDDYVYYGDLKDKPDLIIEKNSGNVGWGYPEGYEPEEDSNSCGKDEWWETGVPMDKVEEYEKCLEENKKLLIISPTEKLYIITK